MSGKRWGPGRSALFVLSMVLLALAITGVVFLIWVISLFWGGQESHPGASDLTPRRVTCTEPPPAPTAHPTFTSAPPETAAEDAHWEVSPTTTCGTIHLELVGPAALRPHAASPRSSRSRERAPGRTGVPPADDDTAGLDRVPAVR
jgi:hypothetical protein